MRQLVVPPITAQPMSQLALEGLAARLGTGAQRIGTSYECRHGELARMRGYGVVMVRAPAGEAAKISAELEAEQSM